MSIWERSGGNPRDIQFDRTIPNDGRTMDDFDSRSSPEKFTEKQQILIRHLFRSCIQFGNFQLTSGRESPYIFNIPRDESDGVYLILAQECANLMNRANPDIISPVPTASNYIGELIAERLSIPTVYVRIRDIDQEGKLPVDGFREEFSGRRAVIFDDAATTGGSIRLAAGGLRAEGAIVDTAIVVIDREEGAQEALEKDGIRLLAVFGAREMFEYARGAVTQMGQRILSDENYEAAIRHLDLYARKPT
ncbi:MAG: hypothetical protein A3C30_02535 [Candidatus Levybacteria bacterium RIFCSPHIGHO2_02_FULL_40_18]|nr:MAG: hypothetical protein A2869_05440 [Candidatus Levybacteria bacterium RIFCSPHIGHO2_01_FULL_40_58]OGH26855.1 MAG: hypothetical protein A3C30_02535 [Candidatus Levybacteria bacterium RIFCSPHIGHO2_02_FULL_40_18]OGH31977.1 MAG: hypothetical protein A3E43_03515 [Candidatus Levybacteria bacterium RIFCSPHIGHO2_12_FULL_40_31]OGH40901.1 MAG: hypothetical protein A2894_04885 [Candidatus Levybacteria bacterium RIFCSPLOWO2_01_FULL_40_64]OGH49531.1 MAG: hypothetical protein A3I54_00060 [Candidatus Lev